MSKELKVDTFAVTVVEDKVAASIQKLTDIEQAFIMKYSEKHDYNAAIAYAYKSNGHKAPLIDLRRKEANIILQRPLVIKALETLTKQKAKVFSDSIANTGVKVIETFDKVADAKKELENINKQVRYIDIKISDAMTIDDEHAYVMWSNELRKWMKSKATVSELIRKNTNTVNDIINSNKDKSIVKAGSLVINIGQQTERNVVDLGENIVEADIIEEEIFDFE